mmetsp:Transcript_151812/g.487151  ORF Transcript_151812/g.487151 Transcript_151812/m.487151 type:complete len:232 (-) Transcript_151812:1580-2275(-)
MRTSQRGVWQAPGSSASVDECRRSTKRVRTPLSCGSAGRSPKELAECAVPRARRRWLGERASHAERNSSACFAMVAGIPSSSNAASPLTLQPSDSCPRKTWMRPLCDDSSNLKSPACAAEAAANARRGTASRGSATSFSPSRWVSEAGPPAASPAAASGPAAAGPSCTADTSAIFRCKVFHRCRSASQQWETTLRLQRESFTRCLPTAEWARNTITSTTRFCPRLCKRSSA